MKGEIGIAIGNLLGVPLGDKVLYAVLATGLLAVKHEAFPAKRKECQNVSFMRQLFLVLSRLMEQWLQKTY